MLARVPREAPALKVVVEVDAEAAAIHAGFVVARVDLLAAFSILHVVAVGAGAVLR